MRIKLPAETHGVQFMVRCSGSADSRTRNSAIWAELSIVLVPEVQVEFKTSPLPKALRSLLLCWARQPTSSLSSSRRPPLNQARQRFGAAGLAQNLTTP